MILVVFDPRAGKRISLDIADLPEDHSFVTSGWADARGSRHRPEHAEEREHDHGEDQHEAEHATAPQMLPSDASEDHNALAPVAE